MMQSGIAGLENKHHAQYILQILNQKEYAPITPCINAYINPMKKCWNSEVLKALPWDKKLSWTQEHQHL